MKLEDLLHSNPNPEGQEISMEEVYERIKNAYSKNFSFESFYDYEISKLQIKTLRENGYDVEWRRDCLWYEVRGWK